MILTSRNVDASWRMVFNLNIIHLHNHPAFSKDAHVVINVFVLKYDRRKVSQELECNFLGSGDNVIDSSTMEKIKKNDYNGRKMEKAL